MSEIIELPWVQHTIYSIIILVGMAIVGSVLGRGFDTLEKALPLPKLGFVVVRRVVRYLVYALGVVLILERWGVDMKTVLAVVGGVMGMVAIGFVAVWSLLSNMSCAFVLSAFRPFCIGDEIEIPGDAVTGKVIDVNLLYVTLKTDANDYVKVPNNQFIQKIFRCRKGSSTVALKDQLMRPDPLE